MSKDNKTILPSITPNEDSQKKIVNASRKPRGAKKIRYPISIVNLTFSSVEKISILYTKKTLPKIGTTEAAKKFLKSGKKHASPVKKIAVESQFALFYEQINNTWQYDKIIKDLDKLILESNHVGKKNQEKLKFMLAEYKRKMEKYWDESYVANEALNAKINPKMKEGDVNF